MFKPGSRTVANGFDLVPNVGIGGETHYVEIVHNALSDGVASVEIQCIIKRGESRVRADGYIFALDFALFPLLVKSLGLGGTRSVGLAFGVKV